MCGRRPALVRQILSMAVFQLRADVRKFYARIGQQNHRMIQKVGAFPDDLLFVSVLCGDDEAKIKFFTKILCP